MSGSDVLDWLLPEADEGERTDTRRRLTFLRLFFDDARSAGLRDVGAGFRAARDELSAVRRDGLLELYADLLRYHLLEALSPDAFADFGAPYRTLQETWSRLEGCRAEAGGLPDVPRPGEAALAVADRLLSAARGEGAPEPWLAIWSTRRACVAESAERAREIWSGLGERARAEGFGLGFEALTLAGEARALLDARDPRGARDLLARNLSQTSRDVGLAWLFAWSALLSGEPSIAFEVVRGRAPRTGRLPRPLAELRERVPAWAPVLAGTPAASPTERDGIPGPEDVGSRRDFGALVLEVVHLDGSGGARTLLLDPAPGARDRVERERSRREGAWTRPGEPEQAVLASGAPWFGHALQEDARAGGSTGRSPRASLAAGLARSLALAPLLDGDGEVAGWIRVECEHHLLPSRSRLAEAGRAWSREIPRSAPRTSGPAVASDSEPRPVRPRDARLSAFARSVVEGLPMKLGRRRVWFLEEGAALQCLFEAGEALSNAEGHPGSGRVLARARRTRRPVRFEDPGDEPPGLHARSASGLAVPLVVTGRVHGLLVCESSRARDFRTEDLERLERFAASHAIGWRSTQFAAWHRRTCAEDVHLDLGALAWRDRLEELVAAARSEAPVALHGPEGAGKEVLARWMHFEGARSGAPLRVHRSGTRVALELALVREAGGTLVLDDFDGLTHVDQAGLLGVLNEDDGNRARSGGRTRCIALARSTLAEAVAAGRLRSDLAALFAARETRVPALADRRDEIPALAQLLLERVAETEGAPVLEITEEARRLLWRQAWPGNVRELEGLLRRAALRRPGVPIDARGLRLSARAGGRGRLAARLPSKRPRELDLRLALETTRHRNGAWNRTRAAAYLGWDPDTLKLRLAERGLVEPANGPPGGPAGGGTESAESGGGAPDS